jgi:ABC-2 type transport system permease protein
VLRGLWRLTWLEIKIFVREPLGVIGSVLMPVIIFVVIGRAIGGGGATSAMAQFIRTDLPVLAAVLIAFSAVLSLVTIVSIYREGGILKRLRATPLGPATILTAHVLVKLLFTALTLAALAAAGRRFYPVDLDPPLLSFGVALLLATLSLVSLGVILASMVPTARFAQPIAAVILYPMLGLSGLFTPIEALPSALQALARVLPLTYVVSLLRGIWRGDGWLAHAGDLAAIALIFAICTAVSVQVFRWE